MRYVTNKKNLAFTVLAHGDLQSVVFVGGKFPPETKAELSDQEMIGAIEAHRFFGRGFFREGQQVVNRFGMTKQDLDAMRQKAREALALDGAEPSEPSEAPKIPTPAEIRALRKVETIEVMEGLGIDHDSGTPIATLKKQLREWIAENA